MGIPLDIVYEDETSRQVYGRNLHFAVWYDAPVVEQMHEWGRRAAAIRKANPEGTGLMNLVVSGTPAFSAEVREAVKEYTEHGVHNVGAAHIILVRGLLASAVRGFLSTAMLLGRPKNPTKVFAEVQPACQWMVRNTATTGGQEWTADDILDCCQRAIER